MTRLKTNTGLGMLIRIGIGAIAATLLSASAALAATEVDVLGNFEIIIGDTGDRWDGWDESDTRTYVRVRDQHGRTRDHYFDNIASAFFVLREKYGTVRVLELGVPEYAGRRHESHGHEGHGLIDGMRAWYVWDTDRHARGGLPLILAFYDRSEAREMAYDRGGEVLDFEELVYNLKRWSDRGRSRIYWRGWHTDRWGGNRWNNAWNHRWNGYGWDRDRGWALRVTLDNDGIRGGNLRYSDGGVNSRVRYRNNDRGRGRGRHDDNHRHDDDRYRRSGNRDDRHDHDARDDRDRDDHDDDDKKYKREKKREKNR